MQKDNSIGRHSSLGVRHGCDTLTLTNPLPALSCVDRPDLRPLITNTTRLCRGELRVLTSGRLFSFSFWLVKNKPAVCFCRTLSSRKSGKKRKRGFVSGRCWETAPFIEHLCSFLTNALTEVDVRAVSVGTCFLQLPNVLEVRVGRGRVSGWGG